MRDMGSTGVACLHAGIPIFKLTRFDKALKRELDTGSVKTSATSSLTDMVGPEGNDATRSNDDAGQRNVYLMDLIIGTASTRAQRAKLWEEFRVTAANAFPRNT